MRAHAAARFTLTHFGAWRWAVRLTTAVLALVMLAWVLSAGSPARALGWPWVLGLIALLMAWLVRVQVRDRAVNLQWDGRKWRVDTGDSVGREPQPGDLDVAIDLGMWMLLRFRADDRSARPRVAWIAAQRAGHAAQWHALRCAVYSPRPDAGADAAPDV